MRLIIISIALFFCLSTVPGWGENTKIVLATSEYPPYYGMDLKNQGFITEIIKRAYEINSYEVDVRFFPWARALNYAKEGRFDGLYTVWYRKNREEWFYFSDPLPKNEIIFLKKKDRKITYTTLSDLTGYKIGVVRGFAYYPPEFNEADYLTKIQVRDHVMNLKHLFKDVVDLILIDKKVLQYTLKYKFPDYENMIEQVGSPLEAPEQYLVIPKKTPNAQKKLLYFNQGLQQLKDSGMYDQILKDSGYQ